MIRQITAVVLLFSHVAVAQNTPNPLYSAWMKFKPGATATYSGESRTLGIDATIETSLKLVSVASDKVTIEVRRKGKVRRAKLYYLRGLTGKRARIAEKTGARGESKAE